MAGKIFGGGGGGGNMSALMQAIQMHRAAQIARDAQGRALALVSKQQGEADAETASLRRPGLGRALLAYRKENPAPTLGG
jgi:hypothetical protein